MMGSLKGDRRLSLIVFLLWITAAHGDVFTYNSTTKQLHFRCPASAVDGNIMLMQLSRGGPPESPLANWTSEGAYSEDPRVRIIPSNKNVLEAVMDHVNCLDQSVYKCAMMADNDHRGVFTVNQQQKFNYEGEVTEPVSKWSPLKSRYKSGDKVTFKCSARIGTKNNTFVWETRLPGEPFAAVIEESDTCIKIKQETKHDSPTCEVEALTTLELQLSDADDGREWRCRLQESQHQALMTVAVDCHRGDSCLVPCQTNTHHEDMTTSSDAMDAGPRVGASRMEAEEDEGSTKLVLLAVLPICFTICVIAVVTAWRKKRDKQPPPLVLVDSPPETEYSYSTTSTLFPPSTLFQASSPTSSRRSRRLPDPPIDANRDSRDTDTTYNTARELEDDDDTPKKLICPYSSSQPRPTSSVYVSMSAVNFPETNGIGVGPIGDGEGRRVPGFERSMSVYSNSTAIAEAARSRANSADGGTVRVHNTYKKEIV